MGIVDDKRDVFGQVAAFRTLNEGFPDIKLTDSFPSLNNEASSLDFIIDLLKTLIGFEEMKGEVVDILTYELDSIEVEIKKTLKVSLKDVVSCGVDPSLPDFVKDDGVDIRVDKIDFLNMMKTDPNGEEGKYIYDDIAAGLNSVDFNNFLYNTIQDGGAQHWGSQTLDDDILTIEFFEDNGGAETNTLNIKTHPDYNDKKLTDLNNDYIDSISIFGSDKMLNNIIDGLFGTLTSILDKSQTQLENEEKINTVIEAMIAFDDRKPFTDNFFEFSNEEVQTIEDTAKNRRNGIRMLQNCGNVISSVPVSRLSDVNDALANATTPTERKNAFDKSLDDMAKDSADNDQDQKNKFTIKLNFIELLIRRLMTSITNYIISPKIIIIFLINYKIIYGQSEEYKDGVDFIKQNKELIKSIVDEIRDIIIDKLLKLALKKITQLIADAELGKQKEKGKNYIAQQLSLIGIPQEIIRMITGLV